MKGLGGILGLEQGYVGDIRVVRALAGLEVVHAEGLQEAVVVVVGTQIDDDVLPVGGVLVVGAHRGGLGDPLLVGDEEELGLGSRPIGAAELDEGVLVLGTLNEGIGEVDELVGVTRVLVGLEAEEGLAALGDLGSRGLVAASQRGHGGLVREVQHRAHVGGVVDALGGGGLGGSAVERGGLGHVVHADGEGDVRHEGAVHVGPLTLMGNTRPDTDADSRAAVCSRGGILHVVQHQQVFARGQGRGLIKGKAQIGSVLEVLEGMLRNGGGQEGGIVVGVKGKESQGHRSRAVAVAGDIGGYRQGIGGQDELHGKDVLVRGGAGTGAFPADVHVMGGDGGVHRGGEGGIFSGYGQGEGHGGETRAEYGHSAGHREEFF